MTNLLAQISKSLETHGGGLKLLNSFSGNFFLDVMMLINLPLFFSFLCFPAEASHLCFVVPSLLFLQLLLFFSFLHV